jgi:hypothetical protein
MKIRIKGSSIRIRLSRSEVIKLVHEGLVTESTPFGTATFKYALQSQKEGDALSAQFEDGQITMLVPQKLIQDWDTNNLITIDSHMPVANQQDLYLLLEKDFQCLDATTEDQSDNYINPNKNC